ncbi:putative receptor-like protein kinase [Panicum miliaceum]|uniref:Receptor-like protein kinase n=1 Tax=Panicum miliaceum TaxID=4540 RepID=A0A3L6T7G3_PANMI|nr:putative receptor-like protein kinase [Panicum miliaceum]
MALLNGLGQAATIAQLSGLDAFGLTSMIMQAVHTVRRNKKACKQLEHRVQMIADLLQSMEGSEMMQRPETRRPLNGLEQTLRCAYILVTSCQNSRNIYLFFYGEKLANKFSEVQNSIDFYLQLFPVLSHIDTTRLLVRILNGVHPPQNEDTVKLVRSFTSHSNPDVRSRRIKFPWMKRDAGANIIHRCIVPKVRGFKDFSFLELVDATNNFSPGISSFRKAFDLGVYTLQGLLLDGREVAIKRRLDVPTSLDFQELDFDNEIRSITQLQHMNIVKLLGYCYHGREKILVYEYMLNGNLDSFIFGKTGKSIDWPVRYKIIEGVAQGVAYLHKQCGLHIIHRDLKPSNILLDSDMTPKISYFGLSKILNPGVDEVLEENVFGTPGFVAPEYREKGLFSMKSDVYSFGALLLQIISGKRFCPLSSGPRDYGPLNTWVGDLWNRGRLIEFVDPLLQGESRPAEIMRCIQIALLCVEENREDRPTMWDVILMLSCEGAALPLPKQPAYCKRDVTTMIIPGQTTAAATSNVPEPGPESERLAGCVMGTTLSLLLLDRL